MFGLLKGKTINIKSPQIPSIKDAYQELIPLPNDPKSIVLSYCETLHVITSGRTYRVLLLHDETALEITLYPTWFSVMYKNTYLCNGSHIGGRTNFTVRNKRPYLLGGFTTNWDITFGKDNLIMKNDIGQTLIIEGIEESKDIQYGGNISGMIVLDEN